MPTVISSEMRGFSQKFIFRETIRDKLQGSDWQETGSKTCVLKKDALAEIKKSVRTIISWEIDESREDYLYPKSYFILVELPRKAKDALV